MFKFLKKETEQENPSWIKRLKQGLSKTRQQLGQGLGDLLLGKQALDSESLEVLETRLLSADVGIEACERILERLHEQITRQAVDDTQTLLSHLRDILIELLNTCEQSWAVPSTHQPHSILLVGVNGVGKTTTLGKLTHWLKQQEQSVMIAAGDTFRAAAVDQLKIWGERNQVRVVAQEQGSDSASVIFDGLSAARAANVNYLLADTAGRLHTQQHLLTELNKITRVMGRIDNQAPHDTWLVLDASIGQNALQQARLFNEATQLTGLVVTKLDGTAKGGIVLALAHELQLPIRFIGVGEDIDDLKPFVAEEFVDALLMP